MERCYVCAAEITAEATACANCQTPRERLIRLEAAATRRSFLFGSGPAPARAEPEPPVVRARPKPAQPKRKPKPKATAPAQRSKPRSSDQAETLPNLAATDLIKNRDTSLPEMEVPAQSGLINRPRLLAHVLDVLICLVLDVIVFKGVLWLSERTMGPLVDFSLVPLFFVLLCFTILYFWLFYTIFGRTLGGIVVQRWWSRE